MRNKQETKRPANAPPSRILEQNLSILGDRENEQRAKRTFIQRVGDYITDAAGGPKFATFHAIFIGGWVLFNSSSFGGLRPFDPFPFPVLTLALSVETIFLSLAILMSQRLEKLQADERAKLDLQINLLGEREATKVLELLRAICRNHGMPEADDPELLDLLRPTRPDHVLDDLEKISPREGEGTK